jgi:hypothetical protein
VLLNNHSAALVRSDGWSTPSWVGRIGLAGDWPSSLFLNNGIMPLSQSLIHNHHALFTRMRSSFL